MSDYTKTAFIVVAGSLIALSLLYGFHHVLTNFKAEQRLFTDMDKARKYHATCLESGKSALVSEEITGIVITCGGI